MPHSTSFTCSIHVKEPHAQQTELSCGLTEVREWCLSNDTVYVAEASSFHMISSVWEQ